MKNKLSFWFAMVVTAASLSSCGGLNGAMGTSANDLVKVTFESNPPGAKVIQDGVVICEETPAVVEIPRHMLYGNNTDLIFIFDKPGYERKLVKQNPFGLVVSPTVKCKLKRAKAEIDDPTIRIGEASKTVSRDAPGQTSLERTIIRWNIDSDPRGARVFWRVISSVPDQVKNTNETYLTTTPYEETRSFNILGLSYENSRDVTIEIKVSKRGYEDQVKRFNARQAIDQQEINSFFELVKKE